MGVKGRRADRHLISTGQCPRYGQMWSTGCCTGRQVNLQQRSLHRSLVVVRPVIDKYILLDFVYVIVPHILDVPQTFPHFWMLLSRKTGLPCLCLRSTS